MNTLTKIFFPGLGIGEIELNSVAFNIGNISIAWYALIITFGMIVAVSYVIYRANKIGISYDEIIDFAIFATLKKFSLNFFRFIFLYFCRFFLMFQRF